jgi:hypothetical protein
VQAFCSFKVALDLLVVVQGVHLLEEHVEVLGYFFLRLCANMGCDLRRHFTRVHLEGLHDFLEVATVPIDEAFFKQKVFFDLVLLREIHEVNACEVATVLAVNLLLYQHL